MDRDSVSQIRAALLAWYDAQRRDLPWRRTHDPYAIWVSEVMLQQTRVAAVLQHYDAFLKKYPTLLSLSLAPVADVLAVWSGLGYYRRARLLHHAAQVLVAEHNAQVPNTLEAIRRIPGIGTYTAAALGSIAFNLPVAAVDGNVERVLARVEGLPGERGASRWKKSAAAWLDAKRPGDWNQAMMELGAQVCTPRAPHCQVCPLFSWCRTRGEHPTEPRVQMRSQQESRALVERNRGQARQVLLELRPEDSHLMPSMWELPSMTHAPAVDPPLVLRHSITNTNYYVRVFPVAHDIAEDPAVLQPTTAVREYKGLAALREIPLTGLTQKVLRRSGLLPIATA